MHAMEALRFRINILLLMTCKWVQLGLMVWLKLQGLTHGGRVIRHTFPCWCLTWLIDSPSHSPNFSCSSSLDCGAARIQEIRSWSRRQSTLTWFSWDSSSLSCQLKSLQAHTKQSTAPLCSAQDSPVSCYSFMFFLTFFVDVFLALHFCSHKFLYFPIFLWNLSLALSTFICCAARQHFFCLLSLFTVHTCHMPSSWNATRKWQWN